MGKGKNSNTIDHEVKALLRLLKPAKLLSRVRDDVKLLPVKEGAAPDVDPCRKTEALRDGGERIDHAVGDPFLVKAEP